MNALPAYVDELSPAAKRALLAQLLRERASHAQPLQPLSCGQQALWFHQLLAPDNPIYNVMSAWTIRSALDGAAFRRAWQALADRHPVLRTTYSIHDGRPVQQVHPRREVDLHVVDAAGWSTAELQTRVEDEAHAPFDLSREPPLRLRLFSRSAREHVLLLSMHHLATDVWSCVVLFDECLALYFSERAGAPAELPPLTHQYTDYVRWQSEMVGAADGERLWDYWRQQLAGPLPRLDLPTARRHPPLPTHRAAARPVHLDEPLTARLRQVATAEGTTLYVVLLAAFQALLHRYTRQDDVLVGSMTAGRSRPEFAGIVGYFANPVALRADFSRVATFSDLLAQARATVLGAIAHQDFPFALLVDRLRVERDVSRSPVFDALFTLQRAHRLRTPRASDSAGPHVDPCPLQLTPDEGGSFQASSGLGIVEPFPLRERCARFDLDVQLIDLASWVSGEIHYNADIFDAQTIEGLAAHYRSVLVAVAQEPRQRIDDLPLLGQAERQRLLVDWNATAAPLSPACLHQLFEAQAARTPEAVAVVYGDEQLTYRELDHRADHLARRLKARGVGPETRVGVCPGHSPLLPVALLAVLKAGGAYVPLDPDDPAERLTFLLEDAAAPLLLTERALGERLPAHGALVVFADADEAADEPDVAPTTGEVGELGPDQLAYVLYTSGSTGRPKGVMVSHRSVVNLLLAFQREPGLRLTERDCLLAITPIGFDIAGLELFLPLVAGGRVVLAPAGAVRDGERLARELERVGATILQATPSTWRLLLAAGWQGRPDLRLLCGGETLSPDLAAALRTRGAAVWHLYGSTETTIYSTAQRVDGVGGMEGAVPIGRPLANTRVYVLDQRLAPQPVGAVGELYIGGAGVARGYLGRPELTAERFVPDPFGSQPGGRLYRTGDLARFRPDGALEFLGRADQQVKLRGARIDPGEVEAVLAEHPAVAQAVVAVREVAPADQRLVAYVVPRASLAPPADELRRFLRARLPSYMVPSAFVALEALPLTPNGKLDRRALPAPAPAPHPGSVAAAPRTALERSIAAIWQEVLGVERVGLYDNFFDLGGHSLLLVRAHARVRAATGRDVPLVEAFNHPTVHALAAYLAHASAGGNGHDVDQEQLQRLEQGRQRMRQQFEQRRRLRAPAEDPACSK